MSAAQMATYNSANNVLRLVAQNGKVLIAPQTVGTSHLDSVSSFRGKMIICNMSIGTIQDTRGKLAVINSDIGTIEDHRGVVILLNSQADSCVSIKGKLAVMGSSVCKNVQSTQAVVHKDTDL